MSVGIIKETEIPSGTIIWRSDDIMQFILAENREITVQDVKDMTAIVGDWGGGKKFCNLIIMPEFENVSFEVRQYTAGIERSRFTIAEAFVISSIAMQVIGNFYLQFHKPCVPTRIFNKEDAALEWLYQQK